MGNEHALDPYEAVLADLKAKRAEIEQAIGVIERIRASMSPRVRGAVSAVDTSDSFRGETAAGPLAGLTISEAAIRLLEERGHPLNNPDLAEGFQAGGLLLRSSSVTNTINSVLRRESGKPGSMIVRIGRGRWGLAAWGRGQQVESKGRAEPEREPASDAPKELAELIS